MIRFDLNQLLGPEAQSGTKVLVDHFEFSEFLAISRDHILTNLSNLQMLKKINKISRCLDLNATGSQQY